MKVKDLQQKLDCIAEDADLISLFIEKDGVDLETNRLRFKFEMKFDIQEVTTSLRGEYLSMRVSSGESEFLTQRPFSKLLRES